MPQQYMLWVSSRPKSGCGVDDDAWVKWYIEEHIPDVLKSKTAMTAAMYKDSGPLALGAEQNARKYVVIYQTDMEDPLSSDNFLKGVRHSSERWPENKTNRDIGDFDVRNYKLIQDFDPAGKGKSPPPACVTVAMDPVDEDDFHKWYSEEHIPMLFKMPGYRGCRRYVLGPKHAVTEGEPPKFLAIHELDGFEGLASEEATAANKTPWTVKHLADSKKTEGRSWELIYSQGY